MLVSTLLLTLLTVVAASPTPELDRRGVRLMGTVSCGVGGCIKGDWRAQCGTCDKYLGQGITISGKKLKQGGRCLTVQPYNGQFQNGNWVVWDQCRNGDNTQEWDGISQINNGQQGLLRLKAASGLCLDRDSGSGQMQLWDCNGGNNNQIVWMNWT